MSVSSLPVHLQFLMLIRQRGLATILLLATALLTACGAGGGGAEDVIGTNVPDVPNLTDDKATIAGNVSGAVTSGVTLNLLAGSHNAQAVASTTTNQSGAYSFTGLSPDVYWVEPTLAGYTFTPGLIEIAVGYGVAAINVANGTFAGRDQNFVAAVDTDVGGAYSISGTVYGPVLSGVTVNLTGTATATTTTNASGGYSFSGLASGNYIITPTLTGHEFSPTHRSVTVSSTGLDISNQTFLERKLD